MKQEIKIHTYDNGKLNSVYHLLDNKFHRDNDKPSHVSYYNNGKICFITYCQYGLHHRDYKPSRISFYKNGNISYEQYCQNNVYHNDYGPSIIEYKKYSFMDLLKRIFYE